MITKLRAIATLALLATWSLPASAQPPAKKDPTKGAAASGPAMKVQITMDKLHCLKTNDPSVPLVNKTDEVYLLVAGKSPAGAINTRLPGAKDYYKFKKGQKAAATGWKNKSGKEMGRPMLWSGSLKPGEHVRLSVLMIEQDKKFLPGVVRKVGSALGQVTNVAKRILGGDSSAVSAVNKALDKAMKVIKADGNDYLGCVTVIVRNDNGKLTVKYLPGPKTKNVSNGEFEMAGSGGRYKVTLSAK